MTTQSNNAGKQTKVAVDGLLLLNKPAGLTSNQALQKVKRLLRAKKAGHTGTLDPAATGMLPLCFGEATKVCAFLLQADKTYRVTARLGQATDTGDGDGQIVETASVPEFREGEWRDILQRFIGEIAQIPPMYSALKVNGRRLYELARKGEVVERESRNVRIDEISLLEASGTRLVLRVRCSKGTYIRTLVQDIAVAAGTVAYTAGLHRETVGSFREEDMLDLGNAEKWAENEPELLQQRLLAPDQALSAMPAVSIDSDREGPFLQGQAVSVEAKDYAGETGSEVRVYGARGRFLGVGKLGDDGRLAPRRIFNMAR